MKRIDVVYGGRDYAVSGRELADLQNEIDSALHHRAGGHWLEVNVGLGEPQPTFLLVIAGTAIALVPVPDN